MCVVCVRYVNSVGCMNAATVLVFHLCCHINQPTFHLLIPADIKPAALRLWLWQRWLSLVSLPPGRLFFLCALRGRLRAGPQTDAQTEKPQAVQRSEVEIIDTCWLGRFTAQTQQSGRLHTETQEQTCNWGKPLRYASSIKRRWKRKF